MAMMKMNWATGRMEAVEFPELKRGQILHCWSGMCGSHYEKAILIATYNQIKIIGEFYFFQRIDVDC